MKIIIGGKQVWPVPSRKGRVRIGFKKVDDYLLYTETPLDANGNPIAEGTDVVIELNQREIQSMMIALTKDEPPEDPHDREVAKEALRRMDQLRKESESSE